jgi:uncharacterized protein
MSPRQAYLVETVIFLLLLVPSMGLALGANADNLTFPLVAGAVILHDVALTALALYLVWRGNEGIGSIGWVPAHIGREAAIGAALFIPMFLGVAMLEALLHAAGFPTPPQPPGFLLPRSGSDYILALVLLSVVAVAEETIFRGYLLRRFSQVTGNRVWAIVLSSVIFALGHVYQGSLGVIAVGAIGIAFALLYLWRGSLVAPMVMHFIQNCIGLLIAPQFLAG